MMRPKDGPFAFVAIAGIPGAGKTTLAKALHERMGWPLLSTGDIARRIDPEAVALGEVAAEDAFADAFLERLHEIEIIGDYPVILDGIPRYRAQVDLLEDKTVLLGLTCRTDIAIQRQLLRGRPGDDNAAMVEHRTKTQAELLEANLADGWLYRLAGWGGVINTGRLRREQVADGAIAYLTGMKREAF